MRLSLLTLTLVVCNSYDIDLCDVSCGGAGCTSTSLITAENCSSSPEQNDFIWSPPNIRSISNPNMCVTWSSVYNSAIMQPCATENGDSWINDMDKDCQSFVFNSTSKELTTDNSCRNNEWNLNGCFDIKKKVGPIIQLVSERSERASILAMMKWAKWLQTATSTITLTHPIFVWLARFARSFIINAPRFILLGAGCKPSGKQRGNQNPASNRPCAAQSTCCALTSNPTENPSARPSTLRRRVPARGTNCTSRTCSSQSKPTSLTQPKGPCKTSWLASANFTKSSKVWLKRT